MPIDRSKYPSNWDACAEWLKVRAGWSCQVCHAPHSVGDGTVLTVHHLDGRPRNMFAWNLVAMCAPCHLSAHRDGRGFNLEPQRLLYDADADPVSHRWRVIADRYWRGVRRLEADELGWDLCEVLANRCRRRLPSWSKEQALAAVRSLDSRGLDEEQARDLLTTEKAVRTSADPDLWRYFVGVVELELVEAWLLATRPVSVAGPAPAWTKGGLW